MKTGTEVEALTDAEGEPLRSEKIEEDEKESGEPIENQEEKTAPEIDDIKNEDEIIESENKANNNEDDNEKENEDQDDE